MTWLILATLAALLLIAVAVVPAWWQHRETRGDEYERSAYGRRRRP